MSMKEILPGVIMVSGDDMGAQLFELLSGRSAPVDPRDDLKRFMDDFVNFAQWKVEAMIEAMEKPGFTICENKEAPCTTCAIMQGYWLAALKIAKEFNTPEMRERLITLRTETEKLLDAEDKKPRHARD